MTIERRLELIGNLNNDCLKILADKGKAYAGTGDTLANFKRNAERLGLSKYQIWGVYFNKHIDSVNNAISQNPQHPVDKSEGLYSRIVDVINYIQILHCLLKEDEDNTPNYSDDEPTTNEC